MEIMAKLPVGIENFEKKRNAVWLQPELRRPIVVSVR